jgi:hypothetical protein
MTTSGEQDAGPGLTVDDEVDEWWAWHLAHEREPEPYEPEIRIVSIDTGTYL